MSVLDVNLKSQHLEQLKQIYNVMLTNRKLKARRIVEIVSMSHASTGSNLDYHLSIRKLSAKWVLRLLTNDRNGNHVTTLKNILA